MTNTPVPRSNPERSEATRAALVAAARQLFVTKSYAQTTTPEVVAAAQLTRGALYHHFADKAELFLAVAHAAAAEVAAAIEQASASARSPLEALQRGGEAYFAAMATDGRARLLLLDAPAVLSPDQLLQLSEATGGNELREGLGAALGDAVSSARLPVAALSDLLSAAFDRAALAIANGQPAQPYKKALALLLEGLVVAASRSGKNAVR
jgi:AcrR family transcriptional regulator